MLKLTQRAEKLAAKRSEKKPEQPAPVVVKRKHSAETAVRTGVVASLVGLQLAFPFKFDIDALYSKLAAALSPKPVATAQRGAGAILGWNEASAQQITPEMVAAWIKEKRETRTKRDWKNAPYLNDKKFGFGTAKPGGHALGTHANGVAFSVMDVLSTISDVGITKFTEHAKIVLLNKTEDGTHFYLVADAGMKGCIIIPVSEQQGSNVSVTQRIASFALSDDFYVIESTGQGAIIVDAKNNKVISVNGTTSEVHEYNIQLNGATSDAVVIDDYRFAVIYGSKLVTINVSDKTKGGIFDIGDDVKSEPRSTEMKIIVSSVASSGTAMLVVDAPEWQNMYVYFLSPNGTLELKGSWSKQGLTLGKL